MSSRPGIVVDVEEAADGGEHPNRYIPAISAHIRVYWPPLATQEQVISSLNLAHDRAVSEVKKKHGHEFWRTPTN